MRHDVNNTSWSQEVRHGVKNTSWRQKVRHDMWPAKTPPQNKKQDICFAAAKEFSDVI